MLFIIIINLPLKLNLRNYEKMKVCGVCACVDMRERERERDIVCARGVYFQRDKN
jgi:hypothetical protein